MCYIDDAGGVCIVGISTESFNIWQGAGNNTAERPAGFIFVLVTQQAYIVGIEYHTFKIDYGKVVML